MTPKNEGGREPLLYIALEGTTKHRENYTSERNTPISGCVHILTSLS